ncbi:MAG: AAA family ATPase [Flavobacteriia bacterium]|jgi:DNA-binding MarR family transcriptional regulator
MDKKILNPFILKEYISPEYFCNRKKECEMLIKNAQNGVNTTLISIRRLGKTGLLHHTLYKFEEKKLGFGIYTDMYETENLKDFTNNIANAVLKAFPEKHPLWKKTFQFIKQLRPIISIDQLTGSPEVTLDFTQPKQFESSLSAILTYLDQLEEPIILAIDEFQQITQYPEKNMEAILRTQIQKLKNVQFIFSGSSPHILAEMFHSSKRPFFSSTQTIELKFIEREDYFAFIKYHFEKNNKHIDDSIIEFILDFSKTHTFYTQMLSNRIYMNSSKKVTLAQAQISAYELLQLNEIVFFQYRKMLTQNQWQLLKAIAKEDKMFQPNSAKMIQKHHLGTPSSIQRALKSLLDIEMIYIDYSEEGLYYTVYDCFMSRWLERL